MSVTLKQIKKSYENIRQNIRRTELNYSDELSQWLGCKIFIKFENRQFTGSFKIRGAYNKILALPKQKKICGVISLSAGNHAQGVAFCATKIGVESTIVMPTTTPFTKIQRTKSFGGNVIIEGDDLEDANKLVAHLAKEKNLTNVHPFDDWDVIAGQGTLGLEIAQDTDHLDYLFVPVGGGGLISGCSIAINELKPQTKIIGIQTKNFPSLHNTLHQTKLKCSGTTIADGIAVAKIGEKPAEIINKYVEDVITVEEESIEQAIAILASTEKVVTEGSGAIGLAALLENKRRFANKNIGIILCGGNIDAKILSSVLMRHLVRTGQISTITIKIPDKPGRLNSVSSICSQFGANILEVNHSRFTMDLPTSFAKLDITLETRNQDHLDKILKKIRDLGFPVSFEKKHN